MLFRRSRLRCAHRLERVLPGQIEDVEPGWPIGRIRPIAVCHDVGREAIEECGASQRRSGRILNAYEVHSCHRVCHQRHAVGHKHALGLTWSLERAAQRRCSTSTDVKNAETRSIGTHIRQAVVYAKAPDPVWKGIRTDRARHLGMRDINDGKSSARREIRTIALRPDQLRRDGNRTNSGETTGLRRHLCRDDVRSELQHDRERSPTPLHGLAPFAIRYSFDCVRMKRLPRATAGVAIVISSREFLPSNLNSGPA